MRDLLNVLGVGRIWNVDAPSARAMTLLPLSININGIGLEPIIGLKYRSLTVENIVLVSEKHPWGRFGG